MRWDGPRQIPYSTIARTGGPKGQVTSGEVGSQGGGVR